jgi:ABC-type lipopolysaccharide export system ATPase subunit
MFYRKHQGSVTDRRKFNPRLLEIVYVWDKIRQDLAGFGKKFQELADGNFYYYTMVMLLNAFIFAGVECEYVAEIQKIRQRIKDNLYSILVNNNITLKSKMACVLALLSMRLYKIICCNFVRSY